MRPGDIEVAPTAHPFVKLLAERLAAENIPASAAEARAGFARNTFWRWFQGETAVLLPNIEAALGAVGYKLKAVPDTAARAVTKFQVDGSYEMRGGGRAHVTEKTDRLLHGYVTFGKRSLQSLTWGYSGRRIPAAGEDPCDLLEPIPATQFRRALP